jgi:glutamate-1-semialdehyde 2,1-aminomutase
MPFMTFSADDATPNERPLARAWCADAAEVGGVWMHPHHNWYLTAAHTEKDIAETLAATDVAFARAAAKTA